MACTQSNPLKHHFINNMQRIHFKKLDLQERGVQNLKSTFPALSAVKLLTPEVNDLHVISLIQ